jgi:hypothetical protein
VLFLYVYTERLQYKKLEWTYLSNLPSTIGPVPHGPDIPVSDPPKQLHMLEADSSSTPNELSDSEYGTDIWHT